MADRQCIVMDNGSGFLKIGYAGHDEPRDIVPVILGYKRYIQAGKPLHRPIEGDLYIGHQADESKTTIAITHPRTHGIVTNWSDMITFWRYELQQMCIFKGDELPTLLTELPGSPVSQRLKTAQIMFEKLGVPALHFESTAVLNLLPAGLNTGVVLDIGDGVTSAVVVYKGKEVVSSIQRNDFGGRDLAKNFMKLVEKNRTNSWLTYRGVFATSNTASTRLQVMRTMRELCYVAKDITKEPKTLTPPLKMPNENTIVLKDEAFLCPEALFQPSLIGLSAGGLHEMTCKAIASCDEELRESLYENIILCGGTARLKGLVPRLHKEISNLVSEQINVKIDGPHNINNAWKGGSVLASTSWFKDKLTTKRQYDEDGPNAFI